ncbi:radical SAM protein [Photobacterium alginatilyticum]|uniref:radical SAM protein n=1 Tax=Photobacterium alginatilyticum TaxID=1775171 RepID=UPI0040697044
MLQEITPSLTQKLINALMMVWGKNESQVIDTIGELEVEYKATLDKNIIHIDKSRKINEDRLVSAWDRKSSFIDWCVKNNLDHYSDIIDGRVFNNQKDYIEYVITSKAMLYKLLRSYPASIDQVLIWNDKSSVNDFVLNEKIRFWVDNNRGDIVFVAPSERTVEGYCPNAFFDYIVCYDEAYMCCSGLHASKSMGDPSKQSLKHIWNSEEAKLFRKSIIDGSYRYCLNDYCSLLMDESHRFPLLDEYHESIQKDILRADGLLSHGPAHLNCGFDMSCNLSCPSCRNEQFIESGERAKKIQDIEHEIESMGSFFHSIYISGSGDPFGSPHSKKFLKRMSKKKYPRLKSINLHSNGQLFTQRNWLQLPQFIRDCDLSVEISLDGASKETIETNRRGVNFDKLLDNLKFISKLREKNEIKFLKFSFVVQENNFHEMRKFVSFCTMLNFDCISFSKIQNWGAFSEKEYEYKAVHLSSHPRHKELLNILVNEDLYNDRVSIGNLSLLLDSALSEVQK